MYRSSATPSSGGAPYSGAPQSGAPYSGAPYSGAPYSGAPQPGYPDASQPPYSGAPQQGYPDASQPPYSGAPQAPYSGAPQAPYSGDQGGYQAPGAPYSGGQAPYGDSGQAPFNTPYAQPQKPKSKLPLILGIIGAVVLLCVAGVVVLAVIGNKAADDLAAGANATTSAPKKPNSTSSEQSVEGDLERYKAGDCMTITGGDNTVKPAKCTDPGAWKVLLRKDGTTSDTACDNTDATQVLYQDGTGTKDDLVLCVKEVK